MLLLLMSQVYCEFIYYGFSNTSLNFPVILSLYFAALENVDLVSSNSRKSVQLDSSGAIAKEAAVIHQEVQVMDACNEESQNTPQVVLNEVKNEGTKEMKACPAVPGSTREVDGAEAQVISEKCEGGIVKENYEKTSSKVSGDSFVYIVDNISYFC